MSDVAYDDLDRPFRVTENLTAAEGGNRVSETVYNLDNTVQSAKRAVGSTIAQTYATYTYTNNGLVATVKDAKNNLTAHTYDGHDRKVKSQFPSPTTVNTASATDYEQYGFDANSNLVSLRKRSGTTITLAYDNLNRLLSRTYPVAADNVAYTYDLLGRRLTATTPNTLDSVSYVYDNAGRMTSTVAAGRTIGYQYDAAGNRTRLTWPDTAFFVTTAYDALNRPTVLKEKDLTTLASYAYDDLGRRTVVTLGNGTTSTYGYNTQGDLGSLAHNLAATAHDQTYTYTRNQAREIATHSWSNDLYQWPVAGLVANGTKSYTANGLDQYTAAAGSTITHDTNGNITSDGAWTYGYDQNNRLRTANRPSPLVAATLFYDAEGRLRNTSTAATVSTPRLYDGHDLVAEYNHSGVLQVRHVHGPGVDEPLVTYNGTGVATKTWLYADHLGSIVALANSTGTGTVVHKYGPFGEPETTEGGSRFRYTGQQLLGYTGLMYYKARFYSPKLGRFLQTDPIGTADDMNLYGYVGNNPVNFTDPSGLVAEEAAILAGNLLNPQMQEFALGFVPGYDLFSAASNPNASALDYAAGVAGIIPGAGKGVGLGLKAVGKIDDVARAAKGVEKTASGGRVGDFTRAQRRDAKAESAAANGGQMTCKDCAKPVESIKNERGVPTPVNQAQVHHDPAIQYGGGQHSNPVVLCPDCHKKRHLNE